MYSLKPFTFPNIMSFLYENAALYPQNGKDDGVMVFDSYIPWPCATEINEIKFTPE
jgi:hypothetical protein